MNQTSRTRNADDLRVGDEAPDFALPRVGGGDVRLSDLRGGPVLLVFLRWLG